MNSQQFMLENTVYIYINQNKSKNYLFIKLIIINLKKF